MENATDPTQESYFTDDTAEGFVATADDLGGGQWKVYVTVAPVADTALPDPDAYNALDKYNGRDAFND